MAAAAAAEAQVNFGVRWTDRGLRLDNKELRKREEKRKKEEGNCMLDLGGLSYPLSYPDTSWFWQF